MTTYTAPNKSSAPTYTAISKSLTEQFLLLESGFYALLESGDRIILEQSTPIATQYSSVSKNSTSYSPLTKN